MKKLAKLNGVKALSKSQQLSIKGARSCQVGCAGKSNGDSCYATGASPNCSCPGICSGGQCSPF